jgi:hypothetical protein
MQVSVFRHICKIAKSIFWLCPVCESVCLSVRLHGTASAPTGWIFMTFECVLKIIEKSQVSLKSDRDNRYLLEDSYTLVIISRSILLTMRNVADKIGRENHNAHFMSSNSFPKTVLFVR